VAGATIGNGTTPKTDPNCYQIYLLLNNIRQIKTGCPARAVVVELEPLD
jgi:hypothetical protein